MNPKKSSKAAEIDFMIAQLKAITCFKKDCLTEFKGIFQGNACMIISSQAGSVFFQELLKTSNDDVVMMLYDEIKPCLYLMLKQTYANYFCQLLFKRLDTICKYEIIKEIVNNLSKMLKNMISFKATISILETPLTDEIHDEIIMVLSTICKSTLTSHTRYLKVIEVLITYLKEEKIYKILDIIDPIFSSLLKMKQGYFLLRKIIKRIHDIQLKWKIINLIEKSGIADILNNNNGCLLIKCIIKNFEEINELEDDDNDDFQAELPSATSKSETNNIKLCTDQVSVSTRRKSDELSEIESKHTKDISEKFPITSNLNLNNDRKETPITKLFDLLTIEVVFKYADLKYSKLIYKSHKKIFNSFLLLANYKLNERIVSLMIKNFSHQAISNNIKNLLAFSQNSTVLEHMVISTQQDELIELNRIINKIQIIDLPKDVNNKWLNFKSQLLSKAGYDLKAFDSKLILRFDDTTSHSSPEEFISFDQENFQEFVDDNQSFFEVIKKSNKSKHSNKVLNASNMLGQGLLNHTNHLHSSPNCSNVSNILSHPIHDRSYDIPIMNYANQQLFVNQFSNYAINTGNANAYTAQVRFTNTSTSSFINPCGRPNYHLFSNLYSNGMQQNQRSFNSVFKLL